MSPAQEEAIRKALSILIEHFDTAQVFVSHHDYRENNTVAAASGVGNIYARRGQIEDWLDTTSASDNEAERDP